ncbi:MAG: NAD(P)-binding domain-containing protein, partial [Gammaproteobacteria bacterium]|nr:NAD(P)-binding domain-containing protein [Gammaproteobacteria bacterium]NIO61589.1 NAD(P)-binding domain-containing protein [Gammaproteobacteria bacterium]
MGGAMALNLHKAGHLHRIWNRTPSKSDELAKITGVTVSDSIETLARDCELVLICVSKDADVLEVINKV